MARLSALLKETYDEREALAVDISVAESELTIAARRGGGAFLCLQAGGVFDNPEALDTFRMDNKWSISAPLASNGICNPLRINVESISCVRRYNIGIGTLYAMPIYEYLCAERNLLILR